MRRVAVYAGTRSCYGMMAAAAKSLTEKTRMDAVWFLIEDDAFPEELPGVIRTVNVSEQPWFSPDGPNFRSKWTYMSLMRLALPELFPNESRVLWLDVDTIVADDIGDLFDIDLADNYVAMVREPPRCSPPFEYFNAGVTLMDLDALRRDGIMAKWIRLVNTEPLTALDQDAINLICQREILEIDPAYNSAGHITQTAPRPLIQHFAGSLRPTGAGIFAEFATREWRVKT